MTESMLHSTPRLSDVLREQIRAVGLALRWPAIAGVIAIGIVTVLILTGQLHQNSAIDFHPEQLPLAGLVGLLLPLGVWKGEAPFGSGFFWTLPVDRRAHVLAKVCAGWLWLMVAVAVFVLWLLLISLVSGERILAEETIRVFQTIPLSPPDTLDPRVLQTVRARPEPLLWLAPFTAATATYVLASALALGPRHPLRWIVGAVATFFLVIGVGEMATSRWLLDIPNSVLRPLFLGPYGFDTLLTARTEFLKVGTTLSTGEKTVVWRALPSLGDWAAGTLLWTLAGFAALWVAASRHRETRRH